MERLHPAPRRARAGARRRAAPPGWRSRAEALPRRRSFLRRAPRRRESASRCATLQRGSTPAASASEVKASVTSVSAGKPSISRPSADSSVSVSSSAIRSYTVTSSCLPSSLRGPTTSARLIFAGAATSPSQQLREPGELLRSEILGARRGLVAERGERGRRLLPAGKPRRARASWGASCAGARMRPGRRP